MSAETKSAERAAFHQMKDGTAEDWAIVARRETGAVLQRGSPGFGIVLASCSGETLLASVERPAIDVEDLRGLRLATLGRLDRCVYVGFGQLPERGPTIEGHAQQDVLQRAVA